MLGSFAGVCEERILAASESFASQKAKGDITSYLVYPDRSEGLQGQWLLQSSSCDWILFLPEAAMASEAFLSQLGQLISQPQVDSLQIPILWLDQSGQQAISQAPWSEQPSAHLVRRSAALKLDLEAGRPEPLSALQPVSCPLYRLELTALDYQARELEAKQMDLSADGILSAGGLPLHSTLLLEDEHAKSEPIPEVDQLVAKEIIFGSGEASVEAELFDERQVLQFNPVHTLDGPLLSGRLGLVSQSSQWSSQGAGHPLKLEVENLSQWFWCGADSGRTQMGIELKWSQGSKLIEAGRVPLLCGLAAGEILHSSLSLPAPDWLGPCLLSASLLHVSGVQVGEGLEIEIDLGPSVSSQLQEATGPSGMIPAAKVLEIRQGAGRLQALWNDRQPLIESTSAPSDPAMRQLLAEMLVGDGALDGESLDILQRLVGQVKPQSMLEFGSGSSTIALGWMLKELHGDSRLRLISVEQDQHWAKVARERIARHGLEDTVALIHAPLGAGPAGIPAECYKLSEQQLQQIGDLKPEMCLIDGPAYRAGQSRNQVLEMVSDLLADQATILLDDCFRDPELSITARWDQRDDIELLGIWPTSKGVAQAILKGAKR